MPNRGMKNGTPTDQSTGAAKTNAALSTARRILSENASAIWLGGLGIFAIAIAMAHPEAGSNACAVAASGGLMLGYGLMGEVF